MSNPISSKSDIHLSGYQARDLEVVDYQMTELPGTGLMFRGPLPEDLGKDAYFAAIGAAQTLGCFCDSPYPTTIAQTTGLPALNLGYGGAGPEFFLKQESLLPYLNNARFVVMQVMSGRSQSNSYYQCDGLEYVTRTSDGHQMGAQAAFEALLRGPEAIWRLPLPFRVKRKLANLAARPRARALVDEIRANWVASSLALLERIEVPVILFWFSKRAPAYQEGYATYNHLFSEFPHLITEDMLAPVKAQAASYVECISARGSPQTLISRFTGEPTTVNPANDRPDLRVEPWAENLYYPSPEMNDDGAAALLADPHVQKIIGLDPSA